MRVAAVIPARYDSSRFPGKILARKTGKFLVQHVYERVCQARLVDQTIIATDDERIGRACDEFGSVWQMTRRDHASGTDRVAEVADRIDAEIIVNVQGDEPEIAPANIDTLVKLLQTDDGADMATLAAAFNSSAGEDINNPNIVKVVTDKWGRALYFSRWPIPYYRDAGGAHRKHLGLYAYRRDILGRLSLLEPTPLEKAEKLEQLRALENGMTIAVADVEHTAVGIDTPQQYEEFVERYGSE